MSSRAAVVVLLAAAIGACASTGERLSMLEQRTAQLERRILELRQDRQAVLEEVEGLRREIEETLRPLRTSQADRGEDLRVLQRRADALQEQLGVLEERIGELSDRLASPPPGETVEPRPERPMPPPRSPASVPGDTETGGEESRPTPRDAEAAPAGESDSLYRSAYTDYLKGDYGLAIATFRQYVSRFPDSDRADNALYWIGESQFAEGDYRGARQSFQSILEDYPDGDVVPGAMLKGALAAVEVGLREEAVVELEHLIETLPARQETPIACIQLERLGVEPPSACDRR